MPREPEGTRVGAGVTLKHIVAREVWDHDGSLGTEWTTVGKELIPFLRGIVAASVGELGDDANEMIDIIARNGQIQLRLEN